MSLLYADKLNRHGRDMAKKTSIIDGSDLILELKDSPLEQSVEKEWLLTNSRAAFSSGTLAGCNTRRYHALLIGSKNPPACRIKALANCHETIVHAGQEYSFSCFEFDKAFHPQGYQYLRRFRKDVGVHWDYMLPCARVARSLYLLTDSDCIALVYTFSEVTEELDFSVRPLTAMRDFHALQNASGNLYSLWNDQEISIQSNSDMDSKLTLYCETMRFEQQPQWWNRFFYRQEQRRGQDCFEDLWSPGVFRCRVDKPGRIVLWAGFSESSEFQPALERLDADIVIDSLKLRQKELLKNSSPTEPVQQQLFLASGQFLVERTISDHPTPTVIAGYPWFVDWGRDTFISLEGLCLCTGRYGVAAGVLQTFARAVSEGMIPNRFDDYGQAAHYNSVDASLWFVHAAFTYLRHTGDSQTFSVKLLPAVKWITDSYRRGTRFDIHADKDGLISAGSAKTQLTWMDAKCNDVVFTPRYGKTVEINALWYNALRNLELYYQNKSVEQTDFYHTAAEEVLKNFAPLFWNEKAGCLYDCILPDETEDASVRPNQIFAVSLPYSPLSQPQQAKIVKMVQQHLLTPFGLRTLSPTEGRYIPRYEGGPFERDAAYHQGTVWPWLIGPFVEAYLRVHEFSQEAKVQCRLFLEPLLNHLTNDGCIGSISEIFDGDPPQKPKGCFAQAWSVAEVLRAWTLIHKK
ncbi:MAG: glycogen debranching protein [Planctomycetes bacterium]|nr:glycogen debranching protein [Planctomycetota bacterium]